MSRHSHQLKPLTTSETAYNRAFSRYLELTRKTQVTNDYLNGRQFADVLLGLALEKDDRHVIEYCGIGSGTGVKDIQIFKLLQHHYPEHRIHALIIEPNGENFALFKQNLQEASVMPIMEMDWMKMEAKQARASETFRSKKFHVIVSMESLYYESDLDEALEDYVNHLRHPGNQSFFLISIGSSQCGWNILNCEFSRVFGTNYVIGTQEVTQSLKKLENNCHSEEILLRNEFPIDDVFNEASCEGDALLDFITHCAHFRYTSTKEMKEQFLKRLQESDISRLQEDPETRETQRMFDMSFVLYLVKRKP